MNGKKSAAILAIFCLFGMSFAMFGSEFGMERGFGQEMGPGMEMREEIPLEVRAEFMQATHEGDYETAMGLHEEYGIGGKRMEHATPEMFELGAQIFSAQVAGNWLDAVGLQDELMGLVKETVQAHFQQRDEECAAFMENEEVQELMKEAHEAMQENDVEKAGEIRARLQEIVPGECAPMKGKMHMKPKLSGECRKALEGNEEAVELHQKIKEAMGAGDEETAMELKEQLRELLPEECVPQMRDPNPGMGACEG